MIPVTVYCHHCSWERVLPSTWVGGPHSWRCRHCHARHESWLGSVGGIHEGTRVLDAFAVPDVVNRLPDALADDLREALSCANHRCWRAATVMLRRVLEGAFKAVPGCPAGTLYSRVQWLQSQQILSHVQASSAHAVRAFGNKYGAHPDDDYLETAEEAEVEQAVRATAFVLNGLLDAGHL